MPEQNGDWSGVGDDEGGSFLASSQIAKRGEDARLEVGEALARRPVDVELAGCEPSGETGIERLDVRERAALEASDIDLEPTLIDLHRASACRRKHVGEDVGAPQRARDDDSTQRGDEGSSDEAKRPGPFHSKADDWTRQRPAIWLPPVRADTVAGQRRLRTGFPVALRVERTPVAIRVKARDRSDRGRASQAEDDRETIRCQQSFRRA
jgi:hypothetical protein